MLTVVEDYFKSMGLLEMGHNMPQVYNKYWRLIYNQPNKIEQLENMAKTWLKHG